MCNLYKGQGLPALVRVANDDEARAALDGGAAGVVCPYMETVEQVKALMSRNPAIMQRSSSEFA